MLDLKASHVAGGVTSVEKAKIGLIQFCISPPKTDVSKMHNVPYMVWHGILWFSFTCKESFADLIYAYYV